MKLTYIVCLSLAAFCLAAPVSHAEPIGDFEESPHEWRFSNGGEYPGATGFAEVEQTAGAEGTSALKVAANFAGGGNYVAVYRSLGSTLNADALEFKVRAPKVAYLLVRLKDGSGQTHQHRVPLEDSEDWQNVEITDFSRSQQHWGGNNDKVFQQPLVEVGILIEKDSITEEGVQADIFIDAVKTQP